MSLNHGMTKKELLAELEKARNRVAELEGTVVRQAGIIESFPERKRVESALRESEERFRQLAENIQEVFWITSPDYEEMIYVSPAYEDIWGRSCEELYRKPITWLEVIVDENRDRVMDLLAKSAEQGLDTEYRILRPDGDIRWIRDRAFAVRDEEGDVVRFVGLAENITDRKQVESALRESEEKFRAMVENTADVVMRFDLQGRHLYVNPAVEKLLPLKAGDFQGKTHHELGFREEQAAFFEDKLREVIETGRPLLTEFELESVIGSRVVDWRLFPEFDEQGKVKGAVTVARDVTERKNMEEAVKASEEKFSALSKATFETVFISDEGVCVEANEAASEMFGYSNEEFIGIFGTDVIAPESKEVVKAHMIAGDEKPYEAVAVRKDGSRFPAEFRGKMFHYKGRLIRATSVRDLTERKHTEAALSQAKVAAEDANRAKSAFLANMSHELRTPLNGIMGMLQMIESTPLTEKQQEYIESALGASQSLLFVINDILDISKVEAGKLEIVEEEFNLWDILHVVNEVLRQEANRKKVNLHYSINGGVPTLLVGDSARMRQILFNLLGNAVKFTEQGEVHAQVDFEPLDGEGDPVKLVFAVSDTGMGIPEEHLQHIFEPFSQVSGGHARRFQGTGLGLAIVKRLVEAMGGEVSVESRLGKGTTFHFHVLVKTAESSPGEQPSEEEQPAGAHPLPALRILLVEDNALNLKVLQELLQEQGHAAVGAATGREALAAIEKDRFDVVLMDVQLPEMDGVETTRRIRSGQCGVNAPDIPIVALTAYAMQGDRERFMEAGMDDYLAKPITVKELKDILVRVAGR